MTIGVAETLIECGCADFDVLSRRFAANYSPQRGYGRGTRVILEAIQAGDDHRQLVKEYFPGGSFGNGAAMRAAPVGLAFCDNDDITWDQAHRSALPTHAHPLGIEGAQLIALAVALACQEDFSPIDFLATLAHRASNIVYQGPLRRAARVTDAHDLALFGNGVAATDSVVTAIAAFALTPDNFAATIANCIMIGGDTDTIAAMAGAISGTRVGRDGIPVNLLNSLEDGAHDRLVGLAQLLYNAFQAPSGRPKSG